MLTGGNRYGLLRNPVPELVSRSLGPQGEDELEGPFQASHRSSGKILGGSWIALPKGREEATVQEAKLVVPPLLESEINDSVTVNGFASAVDALKHPTFQETQLLGSQIVNDWIRNRCGQHVFGQMERIVHGAGKIETMGFIQNLRPVDGVLVIADG